MYSSRAAARTPQLPCRSTGPRWKLRVHNPGSETTATDDNQNSKHNPYATRRNNRSWLDLPLEIPTLLLGRAAMAGHICSFVSAPVSGTVDICGTARRVAKKISRLGHQKASYQDSTTCSRRKRRLLILEPQKSCESWVGTQQIRVNCYSTFHSKLNCGWIASMLGAKKPLSLIHI